MKFEVDWSSWEALRSWSLDFGQDERKVEQVSVDKIWIGKTIWQAPIQGLIKFEVDWLRWEALHSWSLDLSQDERKVEQVSVDKIWIGKPI
jgi:hypothetical protein